MGGYELLDDLMFVSQRLGGKGGGIESIVRFAFLAPFLIIAYYLLYVIAVVAVAALCYVFIKGIFWMVEAYTNRRDNEIAFGVSYGLLLVAVAWGFCCMTLPAETPTTASVSASQAIADSNIALSTR